MQQTCGHLATTRPHGASLTARKSALPQRIAASRPLCPGIVARPAVRCRASSSSDEPSSDAISSCSSVEQQASTSQRPDLEVEVMDASTSSSPVGPATLQQRLSSAAAKVLGGSVLLAGGFLGAAVCGSAKCPSLVVLLYHTLPLPPLPTPIDTNLYPQAPEWSLQGPRLCWRRWACWQL